MEEILAMVKQNRWTYAGLTGVCVAFFFTLVSGGAVLKLPSFLFFSAMLFAISLPIFLIFTIAQMIIIELIAEKKLKEEIYISAIETESVEFFLKAALVSISWAIILLVGHFSIIAYIVMQVVIICVLMELQKFSEAVTPEE